MGLFFGVDVGGFMDSYGDMGMENLTFKKINNEHSDNPTAAPVETMETVAGRGRIYNKRTGETKDSSIKTGSLNLLCRTVTVNSIDIGDYFVYEGKNRKILDKTIMPCETLVSFSVEIDT